MTFFSLWVVLETRKLFVFFVGASVDSLWLFLPVKRRYRMRDLGTHSTYNIGKTCGQHNGLKNIRRTLYTKCIKQHFAS